MGALNDAAEIDVTPNVFDRVKSHVDVRREMHGQNDTGRDLNDEAEGQNGAEGPPVIEVFRRGEVHQVLF